MVGNIGGIGSNNIDLRSLISQNISVKSLEGQELVQKILSQTLADVLEQLSLPKNEQYEKLAKALLEYNQPVQKENLEALGRLLKQLGGEENPDLLAFLQSKNIPLHKEIVQTVKSFWLEKNSTGILNKFLTEGEFPQIKQLLKQMPPEQKEQLGKLIEIFRQNPSIEGAEKIKNFLQQIAGSQEAVAEQEIEGFLQQNREEGIYQKLDRQWSGAKENFSPETTARILLKLPILQELLNSSAGSQGQEKLSQLKEQLTNLLQDSSLDIPEKAVMTKLLSIMDSAQQEGEKGSVRIIKLLQEVLPEAVRAEEKAPQNTKLLKQLETFLEEPREGLPKVLKNLILDAQDLQGEKLTESLKKVIEQKKELTQESSFLAKDTPAKETLTKLWPELKGALEGESLLNYYQIPVATKQGLQQAWIKIEGEDGSVNNGEKASRRLVIVLDTNNLGPVKIDLTAQNKGLAFRFGVEKEEVKNYLEVNWPDLAQRLEALNYKIKEVNCTVSQEKPVETFLEMEKTVAFSTLKKIDLLT